MDSKRPLLIFIAVVVVLGAAFWGVLKFAASYNERAGRPDPIAQQPSETGAKQEAQEENPKSTPSTMPAPAPQATRPQATPPAPAPTQSQPKPAPAPNPTPAAPSTPKPIQPQAGPAPTQTVPATGPAVNVTLTALFIGVAVFLGLSYRSQVGRLKALNLKS